MKKIKSISVLWLMVCLMVASACSDRTEPEADTAGGISVRLAVDSGSENQKSRSELTEIGAENHVSKMTIYIYKGTGYAAKYVAMEEVSGWIPRQNSLTYQLTTALVQGADYTLLGVGMDKASVNTYDVSVTEGLTLGETYAMLKNGKTHTDMAESEFFTGTVSFTNNGKHTVMEDLVLKRRVAGVMLYVKDIPKQLTISEGNFRTTDVYVKLCQNQKSSVRLWRDFEAEDWKEPEGQSETKEDSKTLLHLDLRTLSYVPGEDCYEISASSESGLLDNTLYKGSFLLPMNVTEGTTFTVEIWGVENKDGTGEVEGKTPERLKSFVVENKSESKSNSKSYDIRSNYLYCIGKNLAGTEDDQPISLLGEKLQMEVMPWEEVEQTVDFQPARVQAIFNPDFDQEKYRFNCINNEFEVEILPSMNAESWKIVIPESTTVLNADGKEVTSTEPWLYVKTGDTSCSLQYEANNTEKVQATKIKFLMMDYAVQRDWGWDISTHQWTGVQVNGKDPVDLINNDVRTLKVKLITTLTSGQTRTDYLTVSQYNTITVNFQSSLAEKKDDWNKQGRVAICGFSRVDVGDMFVKYPSEGNIVENDLALIGSDRMGGYKSTGWGWFETDRILMYSGNALSDKFNGSRTDGAWNTKTLGEDRDDDTWKKIWYGCAMEKSETLFKKVLNNSTIVLPTKENSTTDECWYLPAQFELEGLFNAYKQTNGALSLNFLRVERWWSSTIADDYCALALAPSWEWQSNSLIAVIKCKRTMGKESTTINSSYYMRQARKFADYYN